MVKGIKRQLHRVISNVNKTISNSIDRNCMYSRGLSSEGYNGGYRQAINDVILALNGQKPTTNSWWEIEKG